MRAEAKTSSWLDELTTPLGGVFCSVRSSLPFVNSSDGVSRTSGGIHIKQESFDLPTNWNLGFGSLAHEIGGGRCWRWYFRCVSGAAPAIIVQCGLKGPSDAIWDAATGENLAAISYGFQDATVHIGTEDDERLLARTMQPDGGFPTRFKEDLALPSPFSKDLITIGRSGVQIQVPDLRIGEALYFHLIAAYTVNELKDDISSWIAVDRSKKELDDWLLTTTLK